MYRRICIALGCLLIVPLALAHGNEEHVMGTVTKVTPSSITVETTAKKTVEVVLTDKTQFEKSGQPATFRDLSVGDRVVIHAAKSKDRLTAHTVKFGSTSPTTAHSHSKQ